MYVCKFVWGMIYVDSSNSVFQLLQIPLPMQLELERTKFR